jgi:hypothetical protein
MDVFKESTPNGKTFGIYYNVSESGESATAPHRRLCPFREQRYNVFVSGVMQARGSEESLRSSDVLFVSDGGKSGPYDTYDVPIDVVCDGLWWSVEVCDGLWWSVLVCRGL